MTTTTPTLAGALRGSLATRVERERNAEQRATLRAIAAELDATARELAPTEVAR